MAKRKIDATQAPAWGGYVVLAGLAAIVIVFGFAVLRFDEAADVATAVSTVSGVIAALVGAYFGIRGSSLAQQAANDAAQAQGKAPAGGDVPPGGPDPAPAPAQA